MPKATRLVVVNDYRFIASWEWNEETESPPCFFLIPPFVASTLASPAAWDLVRLEVMLERNNVAMTLHDDLGTYHLHWRWDPWAFRAPPTFQQMMSQPNDMVQIEYVYIADAVHLAVANLGRMEGIEKVERERLAMSVDFAPGRLSIDGREIVSGGDARRFYFDPRLVIRGLEVTRARTVGFSLVRSSEKHQAILYISSERDQWQVRCSILSLSSEETHLPSYTGISRNGGNRLSPVPAPGRRKFS
ncbi:MAG: hypothetical protein JXB47_13560 [Anaerolineae bacterium]|nr:hypothetical protein [Anaerolineae bacterium]